MMTGPDVVSAFSAAAGMGLLIPARLAMELTGGRYPTRGRSDAGVVVLVEEAVFFVAAEADGRFVLYRLPMLAWWPVLPGHVHTVAVVRLRSGSVRLCVFCGAQVAVGGTGRGPVRDMSGPVVRRCLV